MGKKHEVLILSDEEFAEYKRREKRQSFFNELEKMSKGSNARKNTSFSVKDVKPTGKKEKSITDDELHITSAAPDITEEDWGEFMGAIEDEAGMSSPVESVTDQRITGYQLDSDVMDGRSKYGKVFSPELAMLSEVLKDVKAHGNRVNRELQKMIPSGKGSGNRSVGVSKGFSDLVEAYNSINTSKVQIIKTMADLRTKQMDWEIKERAANPEVTQTAETMADQFYQRIIGGGTKNFIARSMQQYAPDNFEYDPITGDDDEEMGYPANETDTGDPATVDSLVAGVGFNITQPLRGSRNMGDSGVIGDEFGNILNEKRNIDICVYEYGENNYQFVALDQDGEVVEGIELPSDEDPGIVASLTIRPGSEYVYDKYNRKYRVIQMGPVDTSDVDDMPYPYDDPYDE